MRASSVTGKVGVFDFHKSCPAHYFRVIYVHFYYSVKYTVKAHCVCGRFLNIFFSRASATKNLHPWFTSWREKNLDFLCL